jgi:hypothetical protein
MSTKLSQRKENLKYYPEVIEKIYSNEDSYSKKRKSVYNEKMREKHKNALEKIMKDISLLGINEKIEYSKIELKVKHEGKEAEIDIVLIGKETAYYVEYKCNDDERNERKVKEQLRKVKKTVNGKFKKDITKLLYVRGENFKTDILTREGFLPFNYNASR